MSAPLCILLVDDSPFFRNLERQFLKHTPALVYESAQGREALDLARHHRPSLVYLAIDLPGMDGLECCRELRDDPELSRIPVVLIGNRSQAEQESAARAAGCAGFLTKPLDRRAFLETGHRLLTGIDRREPRLTCRLPVTFFWFGAERHGLCLDISSGGMFLKVEPRAAKGELLPLRLRLPDPAHTPVALTGRVAWVNAAETPIKPDYPPGYGLEFVDIPADVGVALRRCFGV